MYIYLLKKRVSLMLYTNETLISHSISRYLTFAFFQYLTFLIKNMQR